MEANYNGYTSYHLQNIIFKLKGFSKESQKIQLEWIFSKIGQLINTAHNKIIIFNIKIFRFWRSNYLDRVFSFEFLNLVGIGIYARIDGRRSKAKGLLGKGRQRSHSIGISNLFKL